MQKLPENWGPLVTNKLQFGTEVALFSQDQWKDIGKAQRTHAKYQLVNLLDLLHCCLESTVRVKDAPVNKRLENYEKIKIETKGWPHSKEHKKRLVHCVEHKHK